MGQESDQLNMLFLIDSSIASVRQPLFELCLFNYASDLQHFEPWYLCSALLYRFVGDNVGEDLPLYLVVRE